MIKRLPSSIVRGLGYYVYLYINPETDEVFYVGKGKGNRALSHVDGNGENEHDEVIRRLHKQNLEPRVEFLIHGLKDEKMALAVEMAAIDLLGVESLSNLVHGHHSEWKGRMKIDEILSLYQRKQAKITVPVIFIRINQYYRYDITETELYDATRGVWKVGPRREKAEYAFAVFRGIVREVYKIAHWLRAGSTFTTLRPKVDTLKGRWEFVGTIAPDEIRKKYVGRSVDSYFRAHSQNPIQYVNC